MTKLIRLAALSALVATQLCGYATAQTTSGAAGEVNATPTRTPTWLKRPTSYDISRVYPRKAVALGIGGVAVLSCKVQLDGSLSECVATSDAPDPGFADAAIKLVPKFRMDVRDLAPTKAGYAGTVKIPITFVVNQN